MTTQQQPIHEWIPGLAGKARAVLLVLALAALAQTTQEAKPQRRQAGRRIERSNSFRI